jgi:ornithine--oxo-acid transaminase
MTSRAFYNDKLHQGAKMLSETFGYEKCIFMNSGSEAGETAIKLARRWGYRVKGIPENKAKSVFVKKNFWGRFLTACGTSDDPLRYKDFGPYDKENFYLIPYNDIQALSEVLEKDPTICSVMFEPIQGEAGIIIPDDDYIDKVMDLCKKHNVLYIDDEVQAGMGRSGKLLANEWFIKSGRKPDIVLLAKAVSVIIS